MNKEIIFVLLALFSNQVSCQHEITSVDSYGPFIAAFNEDRTLLWHYYTCGGNNQEGSDAFLAVFNSKNNSSCFCFEE